MRGHHYYYIPAKIMMSERKEQKPVNDKAIIPMTINQIQNQLKDDSQFQGQNFHTISIVGRLESFRREPRSNMLLFNDGTGNIEGQINIQDGKMPPYAEGIPLEGKQGDYFFVVLKPKFGDDNKKYYIHMIKEVTNYNTLTKHHSDIILSQLIRTKH